MKSETRSCQNCKKDFTIEPEDFKFYEKMKVPAPTWCPECRMIRRMMWRNERTIYHRVCDLCGKNTISVYKKTVPFKIYCYDCFFSDNWDQLETGREYDFSKPFFEQFKELQNCTPKLARQLSNSIINSEYTNHTGDLKNCYLAFASVNDEDCYYINYVSYSKWIFDGLRIFKSEQCYGCVDCQNCQNLKFCQQCIGSFDSSYLFNCRNCSNCFMCSNLVNQSYCFKNKKYTKEEYLKKIEGINTGSIKENKLLLKEFEKVKENSIHKAVEGFNNINSSGNYLKNTKNCKLCFDTTGGENCKYLGYANEAKDIMDAYAVYPKTELCYECAGTGNPSYNCKFSYLPWSSSDIQYCNALFSSCQNCFGCNQINNKSYCILNKQYTKEEYEKLIPRIVEHMDKMPYVDKKGRIYKYGEFFPPEISPFVYNETIAQQYFPKLKEEALDFGFGWLEENERNYEITKKLDQLPDDIKDVDDSILKEVIACEHKGKCSQQCTTAFKITKNELIFYRKMNISLPTLCQNCRHYERLEMRNPMKLWHRKCMKEGCNNEFETSYAPDRPEIVYCDKCYQQEVY